MIRFAKQQDLSFLKHAWDVCFDDPAEFIDWNFERNLALEDTIIAESDGVPASNMQLMPHRIFLRGKEYDVNYVSGVATLPKFRRRGLVREMFSFAFPEMKRRNQPVSLLVPFNYEFYEKFGYKQCYNKTFRYADSLTANGMYEASELSPELIGRLNAIYLKSMEKKNGYALRSPFAWQRILEDLLLVSKGRILFHSDRGIEDGYVLSSKRDGGGWELHEVCGVCSLDFKSEIKPFAMARIIDPVRLLTDMAENFDGDFRLKIIDEMIPENNLTLRLFKGGVEFCDGFDAETDIKELAQLIFGFDGEFVKPRLLAPEETYLNMIF